MGFPVLGKESEDFEKKTATFCRSYWILALPADNVRLNEAERFQE